MNCPYCGAEISPSPEHRFCGRCGGVVFSDAPAPEPIQEAAPPQQDEAAQFHAFVPPEADAQPMRKSNRRRSHKQPKEMPTTFPQEEYGAAEMQQPDATPAPLPQDAIDAEAEPQQPDMGSEAAPQDAEKAGEAHRHSGNGHHHSHNGHHHHSHNGHHGKEHHGDGHHHSHSGHHHSHSGHHHSHSHHRHAPPSGYNGQTDRGASFSMRLAKTALGSAIAVTLVLILIIGLFADPVTSLSVSWFRPESGKITVPLQILGIAERNVFRLKSFNFEVMYKDASVTGTVEWGSNLYTSKAAVNITQGSDKTVVYYNNEDLLIIKNNKQISGFNMRSLIHMLTDTSDPFFDDMVALFRQKGVNNAYPNWTEEVQLLSDSCYILSDIINNKRIDRDTVYQLADAACSFTFPMLVHNSPYKKKGYSSIDQIPDFQKLLDFTIDFLSNHLSKSALTAKRSGAGTSITYNVKLDPGAASRDLLEFVDRDDYFQAFCTAYGASSTTILKKIDFKDSRERFAESPIYIQTVMRSGYLNSCTATIDGEAVLRASFSDLNRAHVNEKDFTYINELKQNNSVQNDFAEDPYNLVMGFLQEHIQEVAA